MLLNLLLSLNLLVCVALIGIVLLQRSEGGALGTDAGGANPDPPGPRRRGGARSRARSGRGPGDRRAAAGAQGGDGAARGAQAGRAETGRPRSPGQDHDSALTEDASGGGGV